jgi:AcrR family transcriptional regulator
METKEIIENKRQTAEERRRAVLDAAIAEFAVKGLQGASTEDIARRAEISQPYVMRLFGTKKELFMEAIRLVYSRILQLFQNAATDKSGDTSSSKLNAMGDAYVGLLTRREELMLFLQGFAAAGDPEIQQLVQKEFGELYLYVSNNVEASQSELQAFFAHGMLLSVATVLDLPALLPQQEWVACLLEPSD